jgi:DNA-binding transcriptional LysR family regulator
LGGIQPDMPSNEGGAACYRAEQGRSLVARPRCDVEDAVRQGRLVLWLQAWQFDAAPMLIVVPSRKGSPSGVRTAFDFFFVA